MGNEQLLIVVAGLLAGGGLVTISLLANHVRLLSESVLAVVGPGLVALRENAEATIVNSGANLAAVHSFLMLLEPQTKPDAKVLKALAGFTGLPVETISKVAAGIWAEAEDLTDGVLEPPEDATTLKEKLMGSK